MLFDNEYIFIFKYHQFFKLFKFKIAISKKLSEL